MAIVEGVVIVAVMLETARQWMEAHEGLLVWVGAVSLVTFIGSLIAVPIYVIRMPKDFFTRENEGVPRSPLQIMGRVLKNALGVLLLIAGLLMLVLPGQGLLTIALAVGLLDFPGKRNLKLRLGKLKGVSRSMNWIRKKAGKEPLEIPREDA